MASKTSYMASETSQILEHSRCRLRRLRRHLRRFRCHLRRLTVDVKSWTFFFFAPYGLLYGSMIFVQNFVFHTHTCFMYCKKPRTYVTPTVCLQQSFIPFNYYLSELPNAKFESAEIEEIFTYLNYHISLKAFLPKRIKQDKTERIYYPFNVQRVNNRNIVECIASALVSVVIEHLISRSLSSKIGIFGTDTLLLLYKVLILEQQSLDTQKSQV